MSKLRDKFYFVSLIALTLIFFFYFSGYYFNSPDQSTQFTAVLHFFDNELYQKDFDMQMINPFAVHTIPHLILFSISKIMLVPIAYIYFLAFIITTFFIFYLIYKILHELTSNKHVGLLACILLILARGYHPLSQFMIITYTAIPYFLAVPVNLLSLYLIIKKKYFHSVVICGILFYIHFQIGFFTFLAIESIIVFCKKDFKLFWKSLLLYTLIILPVALSPLISLNPFAQPTPKYSIKELSMFVVPFHIFPPINNIILHITMLIFIIVLLKLHKIKKEFCYWNYALLTITITGIIFSRLIPVDLVMIMYFLRMEVFLTISFVMLLSITLFDLINIIRFTIHKKSVKRKRIHKLVIYTLTLFFALKIVTIPDLNLPRIQPHEDMFTDIAKYANLHTPKYSLFLTPPYLTGFRVNSQRSNVVDVKTHAIGRGSKVQDEWYDRLLTLCNVKRFESHRLDIYNECNYDSLSKEEYLLLCKKYNADYFVTYVNNKHWRDILIYDNDIFGLYRCTIE